MNAGHRNCVSLLFMTSFFFSVQAQAQEQSSPHDRVVSYPPNIICTQIENFGAVTDGSLNHPHEVVMNFDNFADGQYSYSGLAKNWQDGGGEESANASYDASSGKFVSSTVGIICPSSL